MVMLYQVVVHRLHNFDVSELQKHPPTSGTLWGQVTGGGRMRISRISRTRVQSTRPLAANSSYFSNTCANYAPPGCKSVVFLEHVCKVRAPWLRIRHISRTRAQQSPWRSLAQMPDLCATLLPNFSEWLAARANDAAVSCWLMLAKSKIIRRGPSTPPPANAVA